MLSSLKKEGGPGPRVKWLWSLTWMKLRTSCQVKPARRKRTDTADVCSGGASKAAEFRDQAGQVPTAAGGAGLMRGWRVSGLQDDDFWRPVAQRCEGTHHPRPGRLGVLEVTGDVVSAAVRALRHATHSATARTAARQAPRP